MARKRRNLAEWKKLIETFQSSGLRACDFCREHDIDQKYFSKKKNELIEKKLNANSFVQLQLEKTDPDNKALMVLDVNGHQLNFHKYPDVEYLTSLMKSL